MAKPTVLVILDGWGIAEEQDKGNAISQAKKPNYDYLMANYPHTILESSGEAVGLPEGQMGNSEVGHLNIGSGRIVYQELTRINKAVREGTIKTNPVFVDVIQYARKNDKALHLMGLLSDGGVHSHIDHLMALLNMAKEMGQEKVFVHAFLDGRDVPPNNALDYILPLEEKFKEIGIGKIATVMGRYYAMDRDKRWERTALAYKAMVNGEGIKATMAKMAVEQSYDKRVTDEFVEPTVIVNEDGSPVGKINPEDAVIFYNFRADRARQITRAFVDKDFNGFVREGGYLNVRFVCMTQYDAEIEAPVAYPPQNLENTLGEVISQAGLKQLRIAETEKYAHVTFFFNGGVEEANPGEDRILIPSPKVATYNLQPEMSAYQVTDEVTKKILNKEYDFILVNFANPDMVGHTGFLDAAIRAIEVVDECIGTIFNAVKEVDGSLIITADHGNAEIMEDEGGKPLTAHSSNPVPLILVDETFKNAKLKKGSLRDIAPTVLALLRLEKPEDMTGETLII
ncbi:MAG: 2,3-bisphosphoglycerate-independent phosphoglycerate mutase [Clostridia bacterium]|jgi:2,3-bisphosphoglycerate-independent phosphoglycerate mutase|nr:2,3-bisphosphoglycerate-independent phosphoglycerate mutase [Clostridia bacterium]MDN5321899.1 2,3-bisphosphoglycerate-independent phosphoglycerate mutase [Clostridia bacterium]